MKPLSFVLLVAAAVALVATVRAQDRHREGRPGADAKGFVANIDKLTTENHDFRRVVYTAPHMQLVVMSLRPGEDVGVEVHDVDQFFRIEAGTGSVVINGRRSPLAADSAIVVPAGAKHDIVNTGNAPLQLYTIYAPPHHRDKVVHPTRADAQRDSERFDGKTTE